MGAINLEYISVTPAGDASDFARYRPDAAADFAEHFVAVLFSITLVDHVEMVDVQHDRVGRLFRMILVMLGRIPIKELAVIQTGQRIVHGFISKAITPRPFCVQKYVRSPWLMVQKETLKI